MGSDGVGMKVFNICDTALAFYFQRQSAMVNRWFGETRWRYYYYLYRMPGCQHFTDLADFSTRDEVMAVLESSDAYFFHATRNYRRPLYCRDGLIRSSDYPAGKKELVLIHGQPETQEPARTRTFIEKHKSNVRFFVSTPDQLNLFPGTQLFPAVGMFDARDGAYSPRDGYLEPAREVRVIRRNDWKAEDVMLRLAFDLGMAGGGRRTRIRVKNALRAMLGREPIHPYLPSGLFESRKGDLRVVLDNRVYWQDYHDVLSDMKASDILLENQWGDFPDGGTFNLLGLEAMSLGVVPFNAMIRRNADRFAEWLGADAPPPFPNWEDAADYRNRIKAYLNALVFDAAFRSRKKSEGRSYVEKWLSCERVIPRLARQLEQA